MADTKVPKSRVLGVCKLVSVWLKVGAGLPPAKRHLAGKWLCHDQSNAMLALSKRRVIAVMP